MLYLNTDTRSNDRAGKTDGKDHGLTVFSKDRVTPDKTLETDTKTLRDRHAAA